MKKSFNKKGNRAVQNIFLDYKKRRDSVFSKLEIGEDNYKKSVSKIRRKSFTDFEKNLNRAKKAFRENGFFVHEALDGEQARKKIGAILKEGDIVCKSKTNTAKEIELGKALKDFECFETDLGDMVVNLLNQEEQHPVLPAIDISSKQIAKGIKDKWGVEIKDNPEKLTHYLCNKIRKNILKSDVGITGANFFTRSGQVVLLENEGNISLVSRLPQKHIILAGIDKLVLSSKDAISLCRTAAIFGTGQDYTQYISFISGPSKTADIENSLVQGAQGAREVHLILIDNGRRKIINEGFGDILNCINCGACINFCPVYYQKGKEYGSRVCSGIRGVISSAVVDSLAEAKRNNNFDCTLCGACSANCPMLIPLDELSRVIRQRQEKAGLQTKENKKMFRNIQKHGNPFGKNSPKDTPGELYCC